MKVNTNPKAIDEVLSRGVDEVIVKNQLRERMLSGAVLRVKLGIDPTSPNLHLGRSVPLLKLRDFQELGHKVVFIVGDFTGVIGDTSDKESERPMLDPKTVKINLKHYVTQAEKILDIKKAEIRFNSEWLKKLNYVDVAEQADFFSLAEFIARENIRRRLDAGTRVSLREVLYPLMQGYDSVAVKADVELGGTDQRFNLLAGREMQPHFHQNSQNIIMNPLIDGTDGRKMSSSWGNTINFTDAPSEMFGKIMSISDELIVKYFTYFTRVPMAEISKMEGAMKSGTNPRDIKIRLAREIVRMYHSAKVADQAVEAFNKMFREHEAPEEMREVRVKGPVSLVGALVLAKLVASKSEARRVLEEGGVKVDGKVVKDVKREVRSGSVIQKGKRHFVRLIS
ncbi:MAG: tyrosine--tRNA ligase [Patescibacteria group bacterium]